MGGFVFGRRSFTYSLDAFDADFLDRRSGRWRGRWGSWLRRWRRDEFLAKQGGRAGVVEDAEHELAALPVNAGPAANHLVKEQRGLDVAEENNIADPRHVHTGREEVFGGGDDVRFRAAPEVRNKGLAIDRGHALEGVVLDALFPVGFGPGAVEAVQGVGDEVGVMVAGAKDDGLLERGAVARSEDALEEMGGHGLDAVWHDELAFEGGPVVEHGHGVGWEGLPGVKVGEFLGCDVGAEHAANALGGQFAIVVDVVLLDLARCQVAVRDTLLVGVFVNGLAEVLQVVRNQAAVFLDLFSELARLDFRQLELARRSREADLNRLAVLFQDDKPLAPSRAVALVNDDDIEVAGRVMLEEERRVNRRRIGVGDVVLFGKLVGC